MHATSHPSQQMKTIDFVFTTKYIKRLEPSYMARQATHNRYDEDRLGNSQNTELIVGTCLK